MADLHKKLAMRRKGISGAKEIGSQSTNPAATAAAPSSNLIMDSISSMIPPPPKPETNTDRSEDDSDWE